MSEKGRLIKVHLLNNVILFRCLSFILYICLWLQFAPLITAHSKPKQNQQNIYGCVDEHIRMRWGTYTVALMNIYGCVFGGLNKPVQAYLTHTRYSDFYNLLSTT